MRGWQQRITDISELNAMLVERTQQLNPVLFFSAELSDTESELGAARARVQSNSPLAQKPPTTMQQKSLSQTDLDDDATPEPTEAGIDEADGSDVTSPSPSPRQPPPMRRVPSPVAQQQSDAEAYIEWTDPGHNLETLSEASETSTCGLMDALDEACSSSHEFPSNISLLSQPTPESSVEQLPTNTRASRGRALMRSLSDPHLSRAATADVSSDDVSADEKEGDEQLALRLEDLASSGDDDTEAGDDVMSVGALAASFDARLTPRALSVCTPRSETQVGFKLSSRAPSMTCTLRCLP